MKTNFIFAIIVQLFFLTNSHGGTPIDDMNLFEKKYVTCIESNFINDCFSSEFSNHYVPWLTKDKIAPNNYKSFIEKWANKTSIYKVHKIHTAKLGGIGEKKFYLIELTNGSVALLNIRFRTVQGQWYVFDMQASNDTKVIDKLFFGDFIPPSQQLQPTP